jgi:hypothetical protein
MLVPTFATDVMFQSVTKLEEHKMGMGWFAGAFEPKDSQLTATLLAHEDADCRKQSNK